MNIKPMPANLTSSDYYLSVKYPESGIYGPVIGGYYFVAKIANMVNFIPSVVFEEAIGKQSSNTTNAVLTANDFLKAIAISQRPELAKDLLA